MNELWEILVPASCKDLCFDYDHHKKFDEYVLSKSGGISVMKTLKGEWISPDKQTYRDRMIPVRIACTKRVIMQIINFALMHYKQEAIMAYKISEEVIIKHKPKLKKVK